MTSYLLRRLVASLLLVLLVLSATFVLGHLAPGDPTDRYVDPRIPQEQSERLAELYGLHRPLVEQYFSWLRAVVLYGDWGISFIYLEPVTQVLGRFFPRTLLLALGAMLVQYSIGLPLGLIAARRPGSVVDHTIRTSSLVVFSLPNFWLGLMAVLLFSHVLHLVPAGHLRSVSAEQLSPAGRILDLLHHLILPAVVLGAPYAAEVARFVRNGLLEVLQQDYIRSARARGLGELRVIGVHAMRNALGALTQIGGLSLAGLLSGVFTIEWIFSWPGLGFLTLQAIEANDYPLLLAITALTAGLVVFGNLAADLLHAASDPRVRLD